jgi:hypothetical protein
LEAPCPAANIPWTEEKLNEFSAVLDKYEEDTFGEEAVR